MALKGPLLKARLFWLLQNGTAEERSSAARDLSSPSERYLVVDQDRHSEIHNTPVRKVLFTVTLAQLGARATEIESLHYWDSDDWSSYQKWGLQRLPDHLVRDGVSPYRLEVELGKAQGRWLVLRLRSRLE